MNESNPCDAALAELLTLTVDADEYATIYRNHLGQFHRVHGPAVIYSDGCEDWFQNGKLHREDGPAVEYKSGPNEWWLDGEELTQEEHGFRTLPAKEMTLEEIGLILGHPVKVVK